MDLSAIHERGEALQTSMRNCNHANTLARVFFAKDYYFTFLGLPVGGLPPWTTSETTSRHANVWAACRLQIA